MPKCHICKRKLGMITESHMKKWHNITCKEYAKKFNLKKGKLNPYHSKKMLGKGNPRYGIIPSQDTRDKIRWTHINSEKFVGKKNPMYGKTHDKLTREIIRKANLDFLKTNSNSFYGKKHSKETRKMLSKFRKELNFAHPEKHINSIIAKNYKKQMSKKGGYISKNQIKIYESIRKLYSDSKLNYPIRTKNRLYFADVGIPSIRVNIEYDGSYWHKNKSRQEKTRDRQIENSGWKVIRIKEKDFEKIDKDIGMVNYIYSILNFNN